MGANSLVGAVLVRRLAAGMSARSVLWWRCPPDQPTGLLYLPSCEPGIGDAHPVKRDLSQHWMGRDPGTTGGLGRGKAAGETLPRRGRGFRRPKPKQVDGHDYGANGSSQLRAVTIQGPGSPEAQGRPGPPPTSTEWGGEAAAERDEALCNGAMWERAAPAWKRAMRTWEGMQETSGNGPGAGPAPPSVRQRTPGPSLSGQGQSGEATSSDSTRREDADREDATDHVLHTAPAPATHCSISGWEFLVQAASPVI